ncbi:5-(carboxyamino)imidazole ribonucleotide mutase [Pontibacillus litoralis]|uniref:N5-carboxyaminoimidazole ribonucleotide mutase n=1 Tax=Pontibacillus litoralis JSM 072002 TaxID=1385512 RepID=A0A0A5HX98_9BACI|nr:5-(carboxyamino)imidazole ribonucleotide mutase [Pontibacillus litoralis]KGX88252.1 N5-carboxyaminoimidazole ribonucleotide mutase [Pontibacillus litoralis JSM 072002]
MATVSVVMGSISDWETMKNACMMLEEFDIPYEKDILSAHRTPDEMYRFAETARERGVKVIIAGAGGAAHLPGMIASKTTLPVIGVPVVTKLSGYDSLLSIVQMPGGVPVATVSIGASGAKNAGILAAEVIGAFDEDVAKRLALYKEELHEHVEQMRRDLHEE